MWYRNDPLSPRSQTGVELHRWLKWISGQKPDKAWEDQMKKSIVIGLTLLVLSGCHRQQQWTDPGVTVPSSLYQLAGETPPKQGYDLRNLTTIGARGEQLVLQNSCPAWLNAVVAQPGNDNNGVSQLLKAETYSVSVPPNGKAPVSEGDGEPSCSAAASLERQEPFINSTIAQHALALLARRFHQFGDRRRVRLKNRPAVLETDHEGKYAQFADTSELTDGVAPASPSTRLAPVVKRRFLLQPSTKLRFPIRGRVLKTMSEFGVCNPEVVTTDDHNSQ